jgi:D-glycero-D-manno-heptose 1,7-bisphosphate phosphatase
MVGAKLLTQAPLLIRVRPDLPDLDGDGPAAVLFLDRDGVVNIDTGYLADPTDVVLIKGAAAAIAAANARGMKVVIVSNQSGVGRRYNDWAGVVDTDDRVTALLAESGARYDVALYAGAAPGEDHGAFYRKPMDGMFQVAARLLKIDFRGSWIIGDRQHDLDAGARAGVGSGVLVGGLQPSASSAFVVPPQFTAYTAADLAGAWRLIEPRLSALPC